MAEVWQVQLTGADQQTVEELAARLRRLQVPLKDRGRAGPEGRYTHTIRWALRLAMTADDDTLTRGTLEADAPPPVTSQEGKHPECGPI